MKADYKTHRLHSITVKCLNFPLFEFLCVCGGWAVGWGWWRRLCFGDFPFLYFNVEVTNFGFHAFLQVFFLAQKVMLVTFFYFAFTTLPFVKPVSKTICGNVRGFVRLAGFVRLIWNHSSNPFFFFNLEGWCGSKIKNEHN